MGERTIPELVAEYTAAGAPCISVVTGRWFGGDDQMLLDVAELTDLPLLKKDFITRERQIEAAKEMGASAILLTAQILPEDGAAEADRDHARPRSRPRSSRSSTRTSSAA